jgi:ribosomal protein S27AE
MWIRYRKWKSALSVPVAVLAGSLMQRQPELSPLWYFGLGVCLLLGALYLGEEIHWMVKRQGRPCGHCGEKVQMRSFAVRTTCRHCGEPFC